MRRANLVPASLLHVGPLATHMRVMDRIECAALGKTPKEALRFSLRTSLHAITALDPDGRPLAMFGVSPVDILSGLGTPWFLGRDEVFDYGGDLVKRGPGIIADWLRDFPVMENIVCTSNTKAIRMLRRWGATVGGPTSRCRGVEFVPFRFAR